MAEEHTKCSRLFDPQMYVLTVANNLNFDPKKLAEYDYYPDSMPTRRELYASDSQRLEELVIQCLDYQNTLDATALIAPNVLVPGSVDSIWGTISRRFIASAASLAANDDYGRPIYASLVIDSNALANRQEISDLLTDLTGEDQQPHGFYIVISFPEGELKHTLDADLLANWLYIVHSLTANGLDVIVGYSDYLTAFFGVAGAETGATGWYDNCRKFSIGKFTPERSGGQQPNPRYSSPALYNRILLNEMPRTMYGDLWSNPSLWDEIRADASLENQSLQHWWAIKNTITSIGTGNRSTKLRNAIDSINRATALYGRLRRENITLDPKSEADHLDILQDGLRTYRRLTT
jgi:hypothetical protein